MAKIQYDFGSGRSDPSTFPVAALQAAATKVIGEQAQELAEYPGNLGHPGMRQAMALRETERQEFEERQAEAAKEREAAESHHAEEDDRRVPPG